MVVLCSDSGAADALEEKNGLNSRVSMACDLHQLFGCTLSVITQGSHIQLMSLANYSFCESYFSVPKEEMTNPWLAHCFLLACLLACFLVSSHAIFPPALRRPSVT
mgnify:CR=1 FL=1